ncbi:MAG TPA: HEAT repeat domain-containing protein [Myxococcaceae bacterium]|jgi:HEAT repeat protein
MAHVFISYSRKDQDFAEVVQAKLEKAGHTVSLDVDMLSAGDDWGDKLDVAIRGAHALVLVLTAESRKSEYVTYEWSFALGAGVRVIPIALENVELHPRLRVLQRLDFTDKARPWDKLLVELTKAEATRKVAPVGDGPVPEAIRALDSLNAEERLAAVTTLSQAQGAEAREALASALSHPLADVRIAAARAFPDQKDPRIIRGLLEDVVQERNPDKLDNFATALSEVGPAAVPEVLALLKERTDLRSSERAVLVTALGNAEDPRVVQPLSAALKDPDESIRAAAANALGKVGGDGVAAALKTALVDPDEYVRFYAAEGLGRLKERSAASALADLLAGDLPRVRMVAARALGKLGDGAVVPALTKALADASADVKLTAAEALCRLGDPAGPAFLLAQLAGVELASNPDDDKLMRMLVDGGVEAAFPTIEKLIASFRGGTPPGETVKALAARGPTGLSLLGRVLSALPKDARWLSQEITELLLRSGDAEALQAVRQWRQRQS